MERLRFLTPLSGLESTLREVPNADERSGFVNRAILGLVRDLGYKREVFALSREGYAVADGLPGGVTSGPE